MTNSNLLKSKMIAAGDENFVKCLQDLLNLSRTTASKKLNGNALFDQNEITLLTNRYNLSDSDVREIFLGG